MAQLSHWNAGSLGPILQQSRRRTVAQQIKRAINQRQRRPAQKELSLLQRLKLLIWHQQALGKTELGLSIFQMRHQIDHLALKAQRLMFQFQPLMPAPPYQPLQQLQASQLELCHLLGAASIGFGQPLDEFPVFR